MAKTGAFGEPCVEHHTAVIYDRGGANRVLQVLDVSYVTYSRTLDKKTTAQIKVTGRACREQTAALKKIQPRRHELAIFRGSERVWEGPILQKLSTSTLFQLDAGDAPLTYLDGISLSKAWPNLEGGGDTSIKTIRMQEIIQYGLQNGYTMTTTDGSVVVPAWESLSPKANIYPYLDFRHHPVPAKAAQTVASTQAFQMTVYQHLSDQQDNGGIHFTSIGRKLVVWDVGVSIGRLRVVSEKDFSGDFQVVDAGSDFATIDHVIGTSQTDSLQPPVVGHGSTAEGLAYYGPWERVDPTSSESATQTTPDQLALNSQAKARVNALYPLPLLLQTASGASLIPTNGLTLDKLVPGVEIPVVAKGNIRQVEQVQRLDSITVVEDATGEKITTSLGPVGTVS